MAEWTKALPAVPSIPYGYQLESLLLDFVSSALPMWLAKLWKMAPALMWEFFVEFSRLLASSWPSPGRGSHARREPVDRKFAASSQFLYLYTSDF